jgi:formylglycine-generating enzyme required for sulfatase activity
MCRVFSFVSLIIFTFLSSGCYYNPMPLLGRAVYYPKYEVTQDTDSLLTVHVNKKMDIQFRKLPDRECWIGTTEVSIAQMKASWRLWRPDLSFYKRQPGYLETWPAMNITLDEAAYYCSWLNRRMKHGVIPEGYSVRLPTVEEWEAAARCGTDRVYPWGNEWPPVKSSDGRYSNLMGEDRYPIPPHNVYVWGDYCGIPWREDAKISGYRDGFPGPCPVEEAGMNEWGIIGLAGNVEEWCWDEKKMDYVLKGGYWRTCDPDSIRISESRQMSVKSWAFCPLLSDRRSHRGGGFRVVIAPETRRD